jgi:DNA ligase-1
MRALAEISGLEIDVIALRLMGNWEPTAEFYESVVSPELDPDETPIARPYPFHLAHQIDFDLEELGNINDWQVEWKWDGIRAQVIKREDEVFVWSRGEDLITERFPEISEAAVLLENGTVLDGEILPFLDETVLPFTELQRRIGRKDVSKKILAEVPVILQCYDLLEYEGRDMRAEPLRERRKLLEKITSELPEEAGKIFPPTEIVKVESWTELQEKREESRSRRVEGFMLKHLESPFRAGRQRGDWWKWKIDPFTVDAVLLYAQKGTGKRANLFTDYTFAVWNGEGELVPFAKAYSGLTDAEIRRVDNFVRHNTKETFGPVRSVTPKLVFELAFEAIQKSSRHKSGVAVRFPRILRWREDKTIKDADSLETIHALLESDKDGRNK